MGSCQNPPALTGTGEHCCGPEEALAESQVVGERLLVPLRRWALTPQGDGERTLESSEAAKVVIWHAVWRGPLSAPRIGRRGGEVQSLDSPYRSAALLVGLAAELSRLQPCSGTRGDEISRIECEEGGVKTDSRSNTEHLARVEVTGGERGASMEQTGGVGGGGDPESTALGTFGCGLSVTLSRQLR